MNTQNQYEVIIEEIHHTEKLDAPSGTAIKTAEVIMEELKRKNEWQLADASHISHLMSLRRSPYGHISKELLIVAKREANVPGTHTVRYESNADCIELKHEAKNRRGFAEGAILAARWMAEKKGIFEMKDLLAL